MSQLDIRPISPVFGAEVRGVDPTTEMSDAVFAEIHEAFLEHSVLFFKDQPAPMDEATQVAFGRRFGPLHIHLRRRDPVRTTPSS